VAGRSFVGLLVARGFAIVRVVKLLLTTASDLFPKTELAVSVFIVVAVDRL
jgi:hypothetical protein